MKMLSSVTGKVILFIVKWFFSYDGGTALVDASLSLSTIQLHSVFSVKSIIDIAIEPCVYIDYNSELFIFTGNKHERYQISTSFT